MNIVPMIEINLATEVECDNFIRGEALLPPEVNEIIVTTTPGRANLYSKLKARMKYQRRLIPGLKTDQFIGRGRYLDIGAWVNLSDAINVFRNAGAVDDHFFLENETAAAEETRSGELIYSVWDDTNDVTAAKAETAARQLPKLSYLYYPANPSVSSKPAAQKIRTANTLALASGFMKGQPQSRLVVSKFAGMANSGHWADKHYMPLLALNKKDKTRAPVAITYPSEVFDPAGSQLADRKYISEADLPATWVKAAATFPDSPIIYYPGATGQRGKSTNWIEGCKFLAKYFAALRKPAVAV